MLKDKAQVLNYFLEHEWNYMIYGPTEMICTLPSQTSEQLER